MPRLSSQPSTATLLSLPSASSLFNSPTSSNQTTPASNQPPSTFTDTHPLPPLLVFDLDYTLWPFWVDTHPTPPLKAKDANTRVADKFSESYTFYKDVPIILAECKRRGIKVAVASRTHAPDLGREMLKLLHVEKGKRAIDYFDWLQIFPDDKRTHFKKLRSQTGFLFAEMLFFDDEVRNRNVEDLGVTMYLVRDGVTRDVVDRGVREWRRRRGLAGAEEATR